MTAAKKILSKIRSEGVKGASRRVIERIDERLVPTLLSTLRRRDPMLQMVQVGAHTGNTGNDPLRDFLKTHCRKCGPSAVHAPRAVLVEPVRHLFEQLVANYSDCAGLAFENSAVAESAGSRPFSRLREGVDPARYGLPEWFDQLGSLAPERTRHLVHAHRDNPAFEEFMATGFVTEDVSCLTLPALFAKHGMSKVDFLQVDAEGYDFEIIKSLDFRGVRPRFINYESAHLQEKAALCREFLESNGYSLFPYRQNTLAADHQGAEAPPRMLLVAFRIWCAAAKLAW